MALSAPVFIDTTVGPEFPSGTSIVLTVPAGGVPVGALIVIRFGIQSGTASTIAATDSRGNAYTRQTFSGGTFAAATILTTVVTTALESGDSITVTHSSAAGRAIRADYVTGADIAGTPIIDVDSASGTSTAPSVSTTPTAAGQLVLAAIAYNNTSTFTGDSDTTDGSWSTLATFHNGGANLGRITLACQEKEVTGTSGQTYDGTLGTSRAWAAAAIVIAPEPEAPDFVDLAARFEFGSDFRALLQQTHQAAGRFVLGFQSRGTLAQAHHLKARMGWGTDLRATVQQEHQLAVRLGLGFDAAGDIEDAAVTLAARFLIAAGITADVEQLHELAARLEIGVQTTGSLEPYVAELAARIVLGVAVETDVDTIKLLAARILIGLGVDVDIEQDHQLASRFELGFGASGTIDGGIAAVHLASRMVFGVRFHPDEQANKLAARVVIGFNLRGDKPALPLAARFTFGAGLRVDGFQLVSMLAARILIGFDPAVRYTGFGTGLVVETSRADRREQMIRQLRAGATIRSLIPHGGQEGITGLIRVLNRAVNDEDGGTPTIEPALAEDSDDSLLLSRRSAGQTTRPTSRPSITKAIGGQ